MTKKKYIKLNIDDNHLSLGNLFRIIKDLSKNKYMALQSEIFCILFDLDFINDTTVNNYCVGCRSIGNDYKQKFINKQKRYIKNSEEFCDSIIGILSIIDGNVYVVDKNKKDFINNSESAFELCKKLFNLSKNDKQVEESLSIKINNYIKSKNIYAALVTELLFIVLSKKQPIYEEELKKEVIEDVLNDTSISSVDLQEYLSLKLREGINYYYSLKKLSLSGNAYACYELGTNEYYGYISGEPRYEKAYEYLIMAANVNHPGANFMIGKMFLDGILGNQGEVDYQVAYDYLKKSYELGNIAAANSIGLMYFKGIYPLKKDEEEALKYFMIAADGNYAYAYNNIGTMLENKGNVEEAYKNYQIAADLGESWACNMMGEYYRKKNELRKAFDYYNLAIDCNKNTLCYYAYYNLAKYFYLNGCGEIVLVPDKSKALKYLEMASDNKIIIATLEIFYYYVSEYLKYKDEYLLQKIHYYQELIEKSEDYNEELRISIQKKLGVIKLGKKIDLSYIEE